MDGVYRNEYRKYRRKYPVSLHSLLKSNPWFSCCDKSRAIFTDIRL